MFQLCAWHVTRYWAEGCGVSLTPARPMPYRSARCNPVPGNTGRWRPTRCQTCTVRRHAASVRGSPPSRQRCVAPTVHGTGRTQGTTHDKRVYNMRHDEYAVGAILSVGTDALSQLPLSPLHATLLLGPRLHRARGPAAAIPTSPATYRHAGGAATHAVRCSNTLLRADACSIC
jgi:hypothetical protein